MTARATLIGLAALSLFTRGWCFEVGYRQSPEDAGRPGEWLSGFAANARAAGMAGAATALDGSAAFNTNPAGIVNQKTGEINLLVAPLYSSGQYQSLSVSYPDAHRETIGMGVVSMASGEAEKTDAFGDSIGNFEEQNLAILLAYGRTILDRHLDAGVNFKIVRQAIDGYSATGYGADAGITGSFFWENVRFGAVVHNMVAPTLTLKDTEESFPRFVKWGMSVQFRPLGRPLLFSADMKLKPAQHAFGVEYSPADVLQGPLFLRLGMNAKEYAVGLGIGEEPVSLDYAVSLHELETLHRFGLTFRFGGQKKLESEWERIRRKEAALLEMRHLLQKDFSPNPEKSRADGTVGEPEVAPTTVANKPIPEPARPAKIKEESGDEAFAKAKSFYFAKRYGAAARALERAEALLPEDPDVRVFTEMTRAHLAIDTERYDDARACLLRAVELDPANQEAVLLYGKVKDILEAMGLLKEDNP